MLAVVLFLSAVFFGQVLAQTVTNGLDPTTLPCACQDTCGPIVNTLNTCETDQCVCTDANTAAYVSCLTCLVGTDSAIQEQADTGLNTWVSTCNQEGFTVSTTTLGSVTSTPTGTCSTAAGSTATGSTTAAASTADVTAASSSSSAISIASSVDIGSPAAAPTTLVVTGGAGTGTSLPGAVESGASGTTLADTSPETTTAATNDAPVSRRISLTAIASISVALMALL